MSAAERRRLLRQREPIIKRPRHLVFIRQLPCLATLTEHQTEAAHVRYGVPGVKREMGMQEKDDRWVVPLCSDMHRLSSESQHNHNEREWWESFVNVDPVETARKLWEVSGDYEAAKRIIIAAHG